MPVQLCRLRCRLYGKEDKPFLWACPLDFRSMQAAPPVFCANLSLPLKAVCPQTRMVTGLFVLFSYPTLTTCVLDEVLERHHHVAAIAALCVQAVIIVCDGNEAHPQHGEYLFNIAPCLNVVPAETG